MRTRAVDLESAMGPELGDNACAALIERIHRTTGISLDCSRRPLVRARVGRRLRALGLDDFDDYVALLDRSPDELAELVSVITTNLTSFFREQHHFDLLAQFLRGRTGLQRLWSAACSTGEEPYSMAIVAAEAGVQAKILATDIDEEVLDHTRQGVYDESRLDPLSVERRLRFFERGVGPLDGLYRVKASTRAMVDARSLNLVGPWVMREPVDALFCRNVIIYFDPPTQVRVIRRLVDALRVGGLLFLGHSESLREPDNRLLAEGPTTFRRTS